MSLRNSLVRCLLASVLAACGVQAASGVTLNPHGMGQVLLFPYYTANANNNTLISIVNTAAVGKALRVRFAEGENGRDAYSLNVYLRAYDTWTAAIGASIDQLPSNGGGALVATLVSSDKSCTVPAIPATGVQFSTDAFSGANADPGDAGPSRTMEGTIEVIEMGTIVPGSPTDSALGNNCEFLVEGWNPPGFFVSAGNPDPSYWYFNPDTDLLNPTGGLYATGYIVNVEQGTIFSYGAVAIDGFRADPLDQPHGSKSSVVLHTAPGAAHPNLADALSDPQQDLAMASVAANDATITVTYPVPAQAVDAVSAVLTASVLSNDFSFASDEGASTNYILSYPTRRFYTDPAIVGTTAILPFTELFSGIRHDTETESIPMIAFDRTGNTPMPPCPPNGCDFSILTPGTSVEILNFGDNAGALLGSNLNGKLGLDFSINGDDAADAFTTEGWASLNFAGSLRAPDALPNDSNGPVHFMRASIEGKYFAGMPVMGFAAQNLVNSSVQSGVLANYSSATMHRTVTNCYMQASGNLTPVPCH